MATGVFRELAEDLECPICMDELSQPKVLQCKHVFCAGCLQKWLKGTTTLACPVCRHEQQFGDESEIGDLPEPLIIKQLQEKITRFLCVNQDTGPVSRSCGICDGKASHFCGQCAENLCDTCTGRHTRTGMTQTHKLILITKWTVCVKHPSKLTCGYCKDCKCGLCTLCTSTGHTGQNVMDIQDKDLQQDTVNKLRNFNRTSTNTAIDFDAYEDELNQFMKALINRYADTTRRLERLRKEVNSTIDELNTGLRQHLAAEEKKMAIHKAEIDDIRATRDSLFTFIDDVLQRNSAPDIVMAADELPDISDNTVPVPPKCKQPFISDIDTIIRPLKDLLCYGSLPHTITVPTLRRNVAEAERFLAESRTYTDAAEGKSSTLLSDRRRHGMGGALRRKITWADYDTRNTEDDNNPKFK